MSESGRPLYHNQRRRLNAIRAARTDRSTPDRRRAAPRGAPSENRSTRSARPVQAPRGAPRSVDVLKPRQPGWLPRFPSATAACWRRRSVSRLCGGHGHGSRMVLGDSAACSACEMHREFRVFAHRSELPFDINDSLQTPLGIGTGPALGCQRCRRGANHRSGWPPGRGGGAAAYRQPCATLPRLGR
jgi:hypothetical protein